MLTRLPSTVAEIMTREVVTVDENETLVDLMRSLHTLRFRHLPVTDDDRLIGLLSERDLLAVASSSLLPHQERDDRLLLERFRVHDIMTRDLVTVPPDALIADAGRILLERRFGCVPVVDATNILLGIVTSSDFTRLIVDAQREPGR
ncbi:MAG TPA: CBS domain-containing protein [Polyangiaceae bacterium]|nr:CBS domain-containing protein [Polyangiaceae bacterium]